MVTIYDVNRKFGYLDFMTLKNAERLKMFFKEHSIKDCLELGFHHGKSSAFIAAILDEQKMGHLTTIDLDGAKNKKPSIDDLLFELKLSKRVTCFYEPKSYTWRLMKLLEENKYPIFDFCYIDGGHTWDTTGFAFFLVDMLLKPGGWILFDDLNFSYDSMKKNSEKNPEWLMKMSEKELTTKQVGRVWELLVRKHTSYNNFITEGNWGFAQKIYSSSFF